MLFSDCIKGIYDKLALIKCHTIDIEPYSFRNCLKTISWKDVMETLYFSKYWPEAAERFNLYSKAPSYTVYKVYFEIPCNSKTI